MEAAHRQLRGVVTSPRFVRIIKRRLFNRRKKRRSVFRFRATRQLITAARQAFTVIAPDFNTLVFVRNATFQTWLTPINIPSFLLPLFLLLSSPHLNNFFVSGKKERNNVGGNAISSFDACLKIWERDRIYLYFCALSCTLFCLLFRNKGRREEAVKRWRGRRRNRS